MNNKKSNILGILIDNLSIKEILSIIKKKINNKEKMQIVTINPEMIMKAQNNIDFLKIINQAYLVIPDGYGILWASKKLNKKIKEIIPGIDLMEKLLKIADKNNYPIYFYGAKKNIILKAVNNIKKKFPNLNITGFNNGYVLEKEFEKILQNIKKIKPKIIFIGVGSPKQEFLGNKILKKINEGVIIGIGGSLDIYSGDIKRAPLFIRKMHLEWLYRNLININRIKRLITIYKYIKKIYCEKKY